MNSGFGIGSIIPSRCDSMRHFATPRWQESAAPGNWKLASEFIHSRWIPLFQSLACIGFENYSVKFISNTNLFLWNQLALRYFSPLPKISPELIYCTLTSETYTRTDRRPKTRRISRKRIRNLVLFCFFFFFSHFSPCFRFLGRCSVLSCQIKTNGGTPS